MYRQWLGTASITEDMWATVIEEDECFDYQTKGVGRDIIASEVEIVSTDADLEDDNSTIAD